MSILLHQMHCTPCAAQARLNRDDAQALLLQLHEAWEIEETNRLCIKRQFCFKNFQQTIKFVNAVASIAERENHHPQLQVSFSSCTVRFSTHSCQGLSQNDFICAAKVDRLTIEAERTNYGIIVYIPATHLECVQKAMFEAGAGHIGNYDHCAWQVLGQGQFRPLAGSQPFLGTQAKLEQVDEYRVEMICPSETVKQIVTALKAVHPYEQPAYSVLRLEDF